MRFTSPESSSELKTHLASLVSRAFGIQCLPQGKKKLKMGSELKSSPSAYGMLYVKQRKWLAITNWQNENSREKRKTMDGGVQPVSPCALK